MSQHDILLREFRAGRRLTFLEAATDPGIGVAALSQRVGELRADGHDISDEWVKTATGKRIKCYFMRQGSLL